MRVLLFSFSLITSTLVLTQCNSYQAVLKSSDVEYKHEKALAFYNKGEYYKAIPILEELLGIYKGTAKTEQLYYYYSNCHYYQKNYLIAAYHYKNFYSQYSNSEHAEECLFMYAKCHREISPKASLDQSNTQKAIEAYQLFINTFPMSDRVEQANQSIEIMRRKLEIKAVDNADLYYKTGNYRAAARAYTSVLYTYPDIDNAEELHFLSLKSSYKFAENSITSKKAERFKEVIETYKDFSRKYPESNYITDAERFKELSHFNIIQATFTDAVYSKLKDRESKLRSAIDAYNDHIEKIEDPKNLAAANEIVEESYFLIVKSNYQLAQNSGDGNKERWYNRTIKSYYNFIDKYSSSKFAAEAEKLFETSSQNLNKLKNG